MENKETLIKHITVNKLKLIPYENHHRRTKVKTTVNKERDTVNFDLKNEPTKFHLNMTVFITKNPHAQERQQTGNLPPVNLGDYIYIIKYVNLEKDPDLQITLDSVNKTFAVKATKNGQTVLQTEDKNLNMPEIKITSGDIRMIMIKPGQGIYMLVKALIPKTPLIDEIIRKIDDDLENQDKRETNQKAKL